MKNKIRKGIILAGGSGSRLRPLTLATSKQLMPVYDKPMIYYPLSTLMLSGIKEILIICNPHEIDSFKKLLKNGSQWGISISYEIQPKPEGLAQSFIIGESFINNSPTALILGDNLFYGHDLVSKLKKAYEDNEFSTIFSYSVKDPERYGVVNFDNNFRAISIEEKPIKPINNQIVTGLYFYDKNAVEYAKTLKPSERGELEITDLNNIYLEKKRLKVEPLGRGYAWFDTGTFDSLQEAGEFIRTIENRQFLKISCPEEIAWRSGWINDNKLEDLSKNLIKSNYGEYLLKILEEKNVKLKKK